MSKNDGSVNYDIKRATLQPFKILQTHNYSCDIYHVIIIKGYKKAYTKYTFFQDTLNFILL